MSTLEAEDAVSEMLGALFHSATSSYYDFDQKQSVVTVFVAQKARPNTRNILRENLERIKTMGLDTGEGRISITRVRPRDWTESWKRHFKPIEIGDTLLVKPGWSKKRPRKNVAVVILDPGLSFGTGQHPTTEYCLRELVRYAPLKQNTLRQSSRSNSPPSPTAGIAHRQLERTNDSYGSAAHYKTASLSNRSFLDIGTGSGILAIAAAKLGYHPVRAIDFDRDAVRIARSNADGNGVAIQIVHGDVARLPARPKNQFDFICANLISGLLVREREEIVAQLNPRGTLVLAGILNAEFSMVRRKFEEMGMKLISAESGKEWRSGSFCFA